MRHFNYVGLVAVAVLTPLAGCGESEQAREERAIREATPQRLQADGTIRLAERDRTALGLTVIPVTDSELPESVLRFGRVVTPPTNEAHVVSSVTGRVMQPPRVQLGATVPAGAILLEILPTLDTADQISLGTSAAVRQGEIEAADREVAKAEADVQRARALSPQIVSAAKLQEAETTLAAARARLDALRRASTVASDVQTQIVTVPAPIAGTIVAINATVGTIVNRGDVLAEMLRPGPVWVDVSVPPQDPPGDRYEVITPAGPMSARLLATGRMTETDATRHDRLLIEKAGAVGLPQGVSVSVRVGHGITRGIVLPESAVIPGVDSDTVFVETAPGIFTARAVRVATRFGGQVRLVSGLKPGEKVVVQGAMALYGESLRSQLRHVE